MKRFSIFNTYRRTAPDNALDVLRSHVRHFNDHEPWSKMSKMLMDQGIYHHFTIETAKPPELNNFGYLHKSTLVLDDNAAVWVKVMFPELCVEDVDEGES